MVLWWRILVCARTLSRSVASPKGLASLAFAALVEVSCNCLATLIEVRVWLLPLKNILPPSESEEPTVQFSICVVFSFVYFDGFSQGLLCYPLVWAPWCLYCLENGQERSPTAIAHEFWMSLSFKIHHLLKRETRADLALGQVLANRIPSLLASKTFAVVLLQESLVKEPLQLSVHPIWLPAQRLCWVSGFPWK